MFFKYENILYRNIKCTLETFSSLFTVLTNKEKKSGWGRGEDEKFVHFYKFKARGQRDISASNERVQRDVVALLSDLACHYKIVIYICDH